MLGILLVVLGSLLVEVGSTTTKISLKRHTLTILDSALLVLGASTIPFVIIALVAPETFVFHTATLPIFTLRFILEVILVIVGGYALLRADRSTFALLRTLTIPLLLIIDLFLSYPISGPQIAGALIITGTLAVTTFGKLSQKGIMLSILSAILATVTISLFKIDVQQNSVIAEQLVMHLLMLATLIPLKVALHESMPVNAIRFNRQTHITMLSASLAGILGSFAYALVPGTALVAAAKRGIGVLFALGSGKMIFNEQHFGKSAALATAIVSGIALMATPETFFTEGYHLATVLLSQ